MPCFNHSCGEAGIDLFDLNLLNTIKETMFSNQCLGYCCLKSLSLSCVSFSLQTRILISKPKEDKPMGSQVNVQMKNILKVLPAYYNLLCTVVSSHVAPVFVYLYKCSLSVIRCKYWIRRCFISKLHNGS